MSIKRRGFVILHMDMFLGTMAMLVNMTGGRALNVFVWLLIEGLLVAKTGIKRVTDGFHWYKVRK